MALPSKTQNDFNQGLYGPLREFFIPSSMDPAKRETTLLPMLVIDLIYDSTMANMAENPGMSIDNAIAPNVTVLTATVGDRDNWVTPTQSPRCLFMYLEALGNNVRPANELQEAWDNIKSLSRRDPKTKFYLAVMRTVFGVATADPQANLDGLAIRNFSAAMTPYLNAAGVPACEPIGAVMDRQTFLYKYSRAAVAATLKRAVKSGFSFSMGSARSASAGADNTWVRDETGRLVERATGAPADEAAFNAAVQDGAHQDSCFTFAVTGDRMHGTPTTAECVSLIDDCLMGDNASIETCKGLMMNDAVWTQNIDATMRQLQPAPAIKLLKNMGFKKLTSSDGLYQCQSYAQWLKSVEDKAGPPPAPLTVYQFGAIRDNTSLRNLLERMVDYVNANPALLNKGYSPDGNPTMNLGPNPSVLGRPSQLLKLHVPSKRSAVGSFAAAARRAIAPLVAPFAPLLPVAMHIPFLNKYQKGGMNIPVIADDLEVLYNSLNRNMKPDDDASVRGFIAQLKKDEKVAIRLIAMIERYHSLLECGFADVPGSAVTAADLERLYKKYGDISEGCRRQGASLSSILETLEKLAESVEDDGESMTVLA